MWDIVLVLAIPIIGAEILLGMHVFCLLLHLMCCSVAILELARSGKLGQPKLTLAIVILSLAIGCFVPILNLCVWTIVRPLFGYPHRVDRFLTSMVIVVVIRLLSDG